MTFPTGCPTCDQHGPELPTVLNDGALAFHRAAHDVWHALTEPAARLLRKVTR